MYARSKGAESDVRRKLMAERKKEYKGSIPPRRRIQRYSEWPTAMVLVRPRSFSNIQGAEIAEEENE